MRRALLAASAVLGVAGCAQYWARPGGTAADLEAAKNRCDIESITRFPLAVRNAMTGVGYLPTGGGVYLTPDYTPFDVNAIPRRLAYRACLIGDGWVPAKSENAAGFISRLRSPIGPPPDAAVRDAAAWCDAMFNRRRDAAIMEVFHNSLDQCIAIQSREVDG